MRLALAALTGTIFFVLLGLNPTLEDFRRQAAPALAAEVRKQFGTKVDQQFPGARAIIRAILPDLSMATKTALDEFWANWVDSFTAHTLRENLLIFSFYTTNFEGCRFVHIGAAMNFRLIDVQCNVQNAHNDPRN